MCLGTRTDPRRDTRGSAPQDPARSPTATPPGLVQGVCSVYLYFPPKALAPTNKHPEKHGKRGAEASFKKLTGEEVIFSEMEGVKRIPGQRG